MTKKFIKIYSILFVVAETILLIIDKYIWYNVLTWNDPRYESFLTTATYKYLKFIEDNYFVIYLLILFIFIYYIIKNFNNFHLKSIYYLIMVFGALVMINIILVPYLKPLYQAWWLPTKYAFINIILAIIVIFLKKLVKKDVNVCSYHRNKNF